jgi:hypothetical protein
MPKVVLRDSTLEFARAPGPEASGAKHSSKRSTKVVSAAPTAVKAEAPRTTAKSNYRPAPEVHAKPVAASQASKGSRSCQVRVRSPSPIPSRGGQPEVKQEAKGNQPAPTEHKKKAAAQRKTELDDDD